IAFKMMKSRVIFTLCCCSLLGLTFANLIHDMDELSALIPFVSIKTLATKYYISNAKFRGTVKFLRSDEFKNFITEIGEILEGTDIANYFEDHLSGHDAVQIVNPFIARFNNISISTEMARKAKDRIPRNFKDFLNKVKLYFPRLRYYNFTVRKMEESKEFAIFYKALRSDDLRALVSVTRVSR
ncbi:hypothetical protein KR044_003529, partial [Drosophila immigrans]